MNAADTAWRRPPRPPRPRFLASSILPALTIFLAAILQISASNLLHEHENRNSNLYCNKTLVSTSQCSLRTTTSLCHNDTHASSQLRALTPPEHFSTPLLDTLPTARGLGCSCGAALALAAVAVASALVIAPSPPLSPPARPAAFPGESGAAL